MHIKIQHRMKLILILLMIILISSLGAFLIQNSFFNVRVSSISFETEKGVLAGKLYLPKNVDDEHPSPLIITTHGYLNNLENQEITAIEMSRRGYIVLALDMYDHGDSTWDTPHEYAFYVDSIYDAVQYMYTQPYVLKATNGNGMIAVSGHSMGGFSAITAVIRDELQAVNYGYRKIAVSLAVGADFTYVPYNNPLSYLGARSCGIIAGKYDELFFDFTNNTENGTMIRKNYIENSEGLEFLNRTEEGKANPGEFYLTSFGQRVIYTPNETHMQNTWSFETAKDTIDFYNKAFSFQLKNNNLGDLDKYNINSNKTGQTWWLKEAFTLMALISLFVLVLPIFNIMNKFQFLNQGKALIKENNDQNKLIKLLKIGVIILIVISNLLLLTTFMNRSDSLIYFESFLNILILILLAIFFLFWVLYLFTSDSQKLNKAKNLAVWFSKHAIITIIVSYFLRLFFLNKDTLFKTNSYYDAPGINTIIYWAVASAGLTILIVLLADFYFDYKNIENKTIKLIVKPLKIFKSLVIAIFLAAFMLFVVATVKWVFNTDFRFYVYAVRIFNYHQFISALRYMPIFFIYYFVVSITVSFVTSGFKAWVSDLLAVSLVAGPVILFLVLQYSWLYITGTALYPAFSLSSILILGLIPALVMSAFYIRRINLKTGNIWTSAFFTTIFFALVTLANTTVYLLPQIITG